MAQEPMIPGATIEEATFFSRPIWLDYKIWIPIIILMLIFKYLK